jgi:FkbM family methyltransferase
MNARKIKIKNVIRRLINKLGYDVHRIRPGVSRTRTTLWEAYSHISEMGFQPETVVDVGVASGTPELYTAFPSSYFLLIEPLKEFEPCLKSILSRYNGSYILAAAGANSGKARFNVHEGNLGGSSLYKETMGAERDGYEITVPLLRIDDVLKEKELEGPYLIKADVQGAELEVLEGAQQSLNQTEVVVLEVSLFEFMKGAPQFFDVISYMKDRCFVAYDIILGWNRPLDNALGQVNIVFVKEEGMFRQDHSYAAIEQVK